MVVLSWTSFKTAIVKNSLQSIIEWFHIRNIWIMHVTLFTEKGTRCCMSFMLWEAPSHVTVI